jgi:hypothetical protein
MNLFIYRLADEADKWCEQHHHNSEHYDVFWETKFAELIIKECADIAAINLEDPSKAILTILGVKNES